MVTLRGSPLRLVTLVAALLLCGCSAASPEVVPVQETPAGAILAASTPPTIPPPAVAAVDPMAAPDAAVTASPDSLAVVPDVPEAGATAPVTAPVLQAAVTAGTAGPGPDGVGSGVNNADPAFDQVAETGEDAPNTAPDVATSPAGNRPPPPAEDGSGLSEIVASGPNDRKEVALTFDAGADTGYAPQILDYLRDEGIQATFGMTGLWAEANPDLVRRIVNEGHQLINHTWDHASLTGANTGVAPLTAEEVTEELDSTDDLVRSLTGYEMKPYFRPPYGDYDAASLRYLYDNGYYLSIWWTCDTHGWAGWGSQDIIDYCTTNIAHDEILLLHVGAAAAGDFEALPGLVQFFRDNGYHFVTIEQMLQP